MKKSWTLAAWASILAIFVITWGFWIVPVSWYPYREWLYLLIAIPLINLAGIVAFRTRNLALGVMTVVSVFSPAVVIVVAFLIWGF